MPDIITRLAGLHPGSSEDRAFDRRAEARRQAEEAYRLLLVPDMPGAVSVAERRAVAAFTVGLHAEPATVAHYQGLLEAVSPDLAPLVAKLAKANAGDGPWGRFPSGPLSSEDRVGSPFKLTDDDRAALAPRLAAALAHAHLLTFHPRDATQDDLRRLIEAGWTTPGIVTLSQLVAFLAFQVRAVAGLRTLQVSRAILAA